MYAWSKAHILVEGSSREPLIGTGTVSINFFSSFFSYSLTTRNSNSELMAKILNNSMSPELFFKLEL